MADTENPSKEVVRVRQPVPEDNICPECGKEAQSLFGLRTHARFKHNIYFETASPGALNIPKANTLEQLQPWHMLGITHHLLYGTPYKTWCDEFRNGKGATTLSQAANSPAGKRYVVAFLEKASDQMAMMQMLLDASMPEAFADEAFARYLARQAKDYIALHNMNKAIGLKKLVDSTSKQADTPPQIVINITGDGLDEKEVQTSFEVLKAEVIDDD
jgi:hypothetical protein